MSIKLIVLLVPNLEIGNALGGETPFWVWDKQSLRKQSLGTSQKNIMISGRNSLRFTFYVLRFTRQSYTNIKRHFFEAQMGFVG